METNTPRISFQNHSTMAEITAPTANRKTPGVAKSKKLSTRVDLTPMVDLGFLLITFFIFTTTMSQPTAMRLILPADGKLTNEPESAVITLLLDKKHRSNPDWFEVILKPSKDATYGNTVNILDEMKIDDIHHYVLTDITPYESQLIQTKL
jgi:biopolymer transport protein ExbD